MATRPRAGTSVLWGLILFAGVVRADSRGDPPTEAASPGSATTTEWREDAKNLLVVRELNRAYEQLPFSREYEGVLDEPPVSIDWTIGPNLPVAWKGGVAGLIGDEIALAGGLWMPGRRNLAYSYDLSRKTYTAIPAPPFETAYTQGACDGRSLYVVGGRSAGRNAARLGRNDSGEWKWERLPSLPESEGAGRWVGAVAVIPGKWLIFCTGHPTGTPAEIRDRPALADWRLRLDRPDAKWEAMAAYPGGARALVIPAVLRGELYVFGGSHPDATMRSINQQLSRDHQLRVPYGGVPNYRDAYRYDPERNAWSPVRRLPFPMISGGAIVLEDRYVLLMGSADERTYRVGRSRHSRDPHWVGYGDRILCYDADKDNYSRVGVMPYGVATTPWLSDGARVYGFGGEPMHGFNQNTENVLQIGTIRFH